MNRSIAPSFPTKLLPLQLETTGILSVQGTCDSQNGYHYFKWLQTLEGRGEFSVNDQTRRMSERSGVLHAPGMPHCMKQERPLTEGLYYDLRLHGIRHRVVVQTGAKQYFHGEERSNDRIADQLKELLTLTEYGSDFRLAVLRDYINSSPYSRSTLNSGCRYGVTAWHQHTLTKPK